ncbi:MAG TPA: MotA/TolQ/ExbB proton channel family protein [Polyangiaceae bacterium]|nr:MotA/TolQ/ExbB proton channel family protein [Polyangiaceae bacterium]
MNVVNLTKSLMLHVGSSPVLYLMIGLSVGSVAVILERAYVLAKADDDFGALDRDLFTYLETWDVTSARARLEQSESPAARVLEAGLRAARRGRTAAADAMSGASTSERLRLERRLSILGTLGSNAPFIGLLGTVIGIVMAFDALGAAGPSGAAPTSVMSAIAEALVATAVGLFVAIPAVVAYNAFQRRIKVLLGEADALSQKLLSFVPGAEEA